VSYVKTYLHQNFKIGHDCSNSVNNRTTLPGWEPERPSSREKSCSPGKHQNADQSIIIILSFSIWCW